MYQVQLFTIKQISDWWDACLADIVSNITVDKAGAPKVKKDQEKSWLSVYLLANTVETKWKPFIAFKDAKCESKSLNVFKMRCVVVSSSNGWMNTDLIIE